MDIKKNKKVYHKPIINLHKSEMVGNMMISASKDSYETKRWLEEDELIEGIQSGRDNYSNSFWNADNNEGIASGRKSYEASEW